MTHPDKDAVREFWNEAACGEKLLLPSEDLAGFEKQAETRYRLEPEIPEFAGFNQQRSEQWVLEIGLGLGADHERLARTGARLHGIDLTPRAVEVTRKRLALFGLHSDLRVADAESLPFPADHFDFVYSWGVIYSQYRTGRPGDPACFEARRTLPGHDLPQVELCRHHALDALCIGGGKAVPSPLKNLCRLPRVSRNPGLHPEGGPWSFRRSPRSQPAGRSHSW